MEVLEKEPTVLDPADVSPTISAGSVRKAKAGNFYLFCKRLFDIVFSFGLGLVLAIPMLILSLVIRLDSPGPAIFRQARMGQGGKIFDIYKFRTMHTDAPADMPTNDFLNAEDYMTTLGRFLRKTSLDELPQLWNIFMGDMSFVGYRPVCLTEELLNQMRADYGVFEARPGLTGYAQVQGRDNIRSSEKALLDAEYVANRSIRLDLWCLWRTVKVVITHEGAK